MYPFNLSIGRVILGVGLAGLAPMSASQAQGSSAGVIVYLDPMTTAGVGGTVNLAPKGQETDFEVTLNSGDPADQRQGYKMRVVQGSCATPGSVVQDLDEVQADGKSKSKAGHLRLADVRRGGHVIQVARKNEVVACGLIPAAKQ